MANEHRGSSDFDARPVIQREMTQAIATRVDPLEREVDTQRARARVLGEDIQNGRVKLALVEERMVSARKDLDRLDEALTTERKDREAAVRDARKYAATLVGDYETRLSDAREQERAQLRDDQNQAIARATVWVGIVAIVVSALVPVIIAAWKG